MGIVHVAHLLSHCSLEIQSQGRTVPWGCLEGAWGQGNGGMGLCSLCKLSFMLFPPIIIETAADPFTNNNP